MRRYVRKADAYQLAVRERFLRPARTSLRIVRDLFDLLDRLGVTYTEAARVAGCHIFTLSKWKAGIHAPRVTDLEAILDALGYELHIVKKEDNHHEE